MPPANRAGVTTNRLRWRRGRRARQARLPHHGQRPPEGRDGDRATSRATSTPKSIESVTALDTSGDVAVGLCNAGSLFGDARLDRRRGRRRGEADATDGARAAGRLRTSKRWRRTSRVPRPTTVLALVAEELKSSSALWKACAKAGTVLAFDVVKKELQGWVAEQFRQRGVARRAGGRRRAHPARRRRPAHAQGRGRQDRHLGRRRARRRARGRGAGAFERRRADLRAHRGAGRCAIPHARSP